MNWPYFLQILAAFALIPITGALVVILIRALFRWSE